MRKFIDSLQARRDAAKSEGGFSLIDVVVTVAIIVALSIGGFVAYTGLVTNAKNAATAGAADQVYTAALVASNDGGIGDLAKIQSDYNGDSKGITVAITADDPLTPASELSVTATHPDTKIAPVTRGA